MRKNIIFPIIFIVSSILISCQTNRSQLEGKEGKISSCNIPMDNIIFTYAVNGADTCVTVLDNGALEFQCNEGLGFFCDPNEGKLTNNTLPILLVPVDNTRPFTLTAKVTPGFTEEGTYNAADLFVYVNNSFWQKLAFEQDEYGNHRIVSVITQGTSDDSNHDKINEPFVYLKISSDTNTIANYYSIDKKNWYMVRLYENQYPDSIYLGISSQCPKSGVCTSIIEDIILSHDNVKDFRMGN